MKVKAKKSLVALTVTVFAVSLGGCLSKEETGAEVSIAEDPTSTPNTPPTISGSPPNAITLGDVYAFIPAANDVNNDALTFSIENLPQWATFNSSTGELSGQPLLGDSGVYDQIVVSVSDGTNTSSLPAFSITVIQGALGSMELSWTAPDQNSDGTALTDLAGYRLYYGVSEGNYPNKIIIDSVGTATFVVENLLPDTYFVVATAVNSTGVESTFSNVVQKVVDGS